MDSALLVHRIHFAFTVTFHYLFPQLTMGLAPLIVVLKTLGLRRNDETYHQAARFWAKIFGINFPARRGDWDSHGISVWHELVSLLALCRRSDWSNSGHGRHVCLLPGVGVPGTVSLRREAAQPARALVVGGRCVSGIVVVRLFHHRDRRLDAASRGLRQGGGWLVATFQLLGTGAESLGMVAVCPQHERRRDHRRHCDGVSGCVLSCFGENSRRTAEFSYEVGVIAG